MLRSKICRLAITGAALSALPLVGASALLVAPASAASSGIVCTSLKGAVKVTTGTVTNVYTGCTGNTGKSGKATTTSTSTSTSVKWTNGKATTYTTTVGSGTGCPTGTSAEKVTGKVTADTTGSAPVGSAVSFTVCFNAKTGMFANAPGTKVHI